MDNHRLSGDEQSFVRRYPSTSHLDKYRTAPNPKNNKSTVLLNASSTNINLMPPSYMPKTTLSTFASHKSGTDLRYRDDPNPYKVSNIGEYRIQVQDPFVPKSLHRSQQVLTFYSDSTESPYAVGNGNDDAGVASSDIFGSDRPRMFDKYESSSGSNDFFPGRIQRSQTLKSNASESHKSSRSHATGRSSRVSGSVSISSVGDAHDIEIEGECEIPEPDYEGSTAGSSEDLPLPLPDSSCSEEYSSVSAGSDPDHYTLAEGQGHSPSPELEQHSRAG